MHTYGSKQLTIHNPYATTKVIGAYLKDRYPEGTHEHGYGVIDAYSHMLRTSNPESKTALRIDENGRFKCFLWHMKLDSWFRTNEKVIVVDGTFLRSKYGGVLLPAVAQDAENHISPIAFCVVDSECDASYRYFFEQLRSFVLDTPELLPHMLNVLDFTDGARHSFPEIVTAALISAPAEKYATIVIKTIQQRFAEKFHERRMKFINAPTIFAPSIQKDIAKNINLGNKLLVHQTANYKYIVTGHDKVVRVDLLAKSCICKVFDIDKVPCPHAMTMLRCQYGDDYGRHIYEYSSSYTK
ncbi:hypothetical protein KY290_036267 [Solanum tuberosum]|uniref:SWIM-type domain-containing protein n=1 Tax=Solanum tuberosum TaxID=4113 RepID=A0ABQ7TS58_SOLTU|nr:hypothetical protein KY290_036267 [Solanum tuberosum]